jgi:4a-hydroxytetrahydrobiopterin dehydratase
MEMGQMNKLVNEHCVPINATSHRLDDREVSELMTKVSGWKIFRQNKEPRLEKIYDFEDFKQALEFTQRIGMVADEENHHPALLTEWGKVTVDWWTHKIKGLHRNDFVMAAKSDELYHQPG